MAFRCTPEQKKALRMRAYTTVRQLAEERAQDRKYGAVMLTVLVKSKHRLRPRARRRLEP